MQWFAYLNIIDKKNYSIHFKNIQTQKAQKSFHKKTNGVNLSKIVSAYNVETVLSDECDGLKFGF